MASSSSSPQPKDENHAFSGIEPEGIRRKASESTTLYDVFINHRGPDSKYSLALPLYNSLKDLGVRAFLDLEEMELGQSFPSTIETAIRSAAVHIAIFSKRYAESPWCLAELVLMLNSPAKIIPVFYEVEPSALRHVEKGVYAAAFIQYQSKSRYLHKLRQWKEALQSISFTTGYEMDNSNIRDHKKLLSAVQREVQRIKPLHVARYPVALDKLVEDFEKRRLNNLVQDFEIHCGMNNEEEGKPKIVGIFGMGGVGKTTLSKELFNRKRQQYDRACFLFDVREASVRCSLPSLQLKLLKELFGEKDLSFQSTEEGLSCISNCIKRSSSLSFLIVLDDIDHLKQLGAFSIMDIFKKAGNSLVIITTRNVGILTAEGINVGYHLKGMDTDDARQLFCWHAFSQPHLASGYEDLVEDFLGVCGGLPLSLQVLGSHVHGRDETYWRSELRKLGRTMHQDIRKCLKITFDALSTEEKQIFMDMACFFVEQSKYIAIRVWEASGWSAENGLQALKDKCLVEEIEDPLPVLRMHDHLRDLGREMADELNQPPRLWHPRHLKKMESEGFENIIFQTRGRCFHVVFDKSLNSEVQFFLGESQDGTEKSSCLLLLHLWYPYLYSGPYSPQINNLRHAHHECLRAQPGIPSWVPLKHMQCLRISNGYLKRLWQRNAEAPSELKKLEIYRTFLEEYPDFLGISTHVEKKAKKDVHKGRRMPKLKSLIAKTRRRFSGSLPIISARESSSFKDPLDVCGVCATEMAKLSLLEEVVIKEQENVKGIVLNGTYCPSIRSFELSSMENLIELKFAKVETLNRISISKCEFLKILSVTCDLTELQELRISGCPILEEPKFGLLSSLRKMRISDCEIDSVPGISTFKMLVELNVSRCPKLHELCLAHLSCLEKLEVKNCGDLKTVTGLSCLLNLVEVSISWCWMLQLDMHLEDLNSLKKIELDKSVKVKSFELIGCKNLDTVSGMSFEMIREVNICGCPELKDFPDIYSPNCLEQIIINGCGKLNHLTMTACRILKRVSGSFDLSGLSISDCPMLRELPSFERLMNLEEIRLLQCERLQNMALPTTLKRLQLNSCRELRTITGISSLTKLTELQISECPVVEEMPVFFGLCCLQKMTIDGWVKFNYLQVTYCAILNAVRGNLDMGHLAQLWISDCPELEELPCFAHLTCLTEIRIFRCSKLENVTLPIALKNLQLGSCKKLKSVSEISCLKNLVKLIISQCEQLQLEFRLEAIDSLQRIEFDGCGKLKSFHLRNCQNLKTVLGNFDVERITICGCRELKVLWIRDHPGVSCVKEINIESCDKLRNTTLPTKVTNLNVQCCRHLPRFTGVDDITELCISECEELDLLPSLAKLKCLMRITINSCQKLHNITLPATLKELLLHRCTGLQKVEGIRSHLKLTEISLSECLELEELPILAQLGCLFTIKIHSCQKLHSITLPTTLKKLSVQCCQNLQIVTAIGDLPKLTELDISKCPKLEELPVLFALSSLESIAIDGCGRHNRLKVVDRGIVKGVPHSFDLGNLTQLSISDYPELEELPCFASLTCMQEIRIFRCMKLQKISLPLTLKILNLDSCKELKSVSEISCLTNLIELIISQCDQLKLELRLEDMDSLQTIASDGCAKIKSFQLNRRQNLKRVSGNFDVEWIFICGCDELEELSIRDCSGLSCLEKIKIESCDKLRNITLPAKLTNLVVQRCRGLQRIAGMGDLPKLGELHISKCPDLEDLPAFINLSCLESITVDGSGKFNRLKLAFSGMSEGVSCRLDLSHLVQLWISDSPAFEELACFVHLTCLERIRIVKNTKLQKITLPITLKTLHLDSCKELKHVSKIGDLSKLREMYISDCPLIEELSILAGHSCLERICIYSCENLDKLTLPTTLMKLTVQCCGKLHKVETTGYLSKLSDLCITECAKLEELPILTGLSCLESIRIERLHNIAIPTTIIKLSVHRCGGSQILAAIENLTRLQELSICECPELEELPNCATNSCEEFHHITLPSTLIKLRVRGCRKLPSLGRLSRLKSITIESCERLESIQGIQELKALEAIQLLYCSNAAIQDCISQLKHVPSNFIQVVGRAAEGAESNLTPGLLSEDNFPRSEIWCSPRAVIVCGVVVVSSSTPPHTINKGLLEDSTWRFNLPRGEWILTTIVTGQNYGRLYSQYNILSSHGIMKRRRVWSVRTGEDSILCHALIALIDKLHQK